MEQHLDADAPTIVSISEHDATNDAASTTSSLSDTPDGTTTTAFAPGTTNDDDEPRALLANPPRGSATVPFLAKLVRLIGEEPGLVQWDDGRIVIPHPRKLEAALPRYFRHAKYTSFQRQLNNFGYTKVDRSALETVYVKKDGPPVRTLTEFLALSHHGRRGADVGARRVARRRALARSKTDAPQRLHHHHHHHPKATPHFPSFVPTFVIPPRDDVIQKQQQQQLPAPAFQAHRYPSDCALEAVDNLLNLKHVRVKVVPQTEEDSEELFWGAPVVLAAQAGQQYV